MYQKNIKIYLHPLYRKKNWYENIEHYKPRLDSTPTYMPPVMIDIHIIRINPDGSGKVIQSSGILLLLYGQASSLDQGVDPHLSEAETTSF